MLPRYHRAALFGCSTYRLVKKVACNAFQAPFDELLWSASLRFRSACRGHGRRTKLLWKHSILHVVAIGRNLHFMHECSGYMYELLFWSFVVVACKAAATKITTLIHRAFIVIIDKSRNFWKAVLSLVTNFSTGFATRRGVATLNWP